MQFRLLSLFRATPQTVLRRTYMNSVGFKGTHSPYQTESKHLSPLNGLAFRELNGPERMYKMETNMASVSLVKELFYLHGEEFRSTKNKAKVGYFLTPELIAKIIYHIIHHTLDLPETRDALCRELITVTEAAGAKLTKKKINAFLDLVINSKKENDLTCPANMTENILLSFLCYKADSRAEINQYMTTLQQLDPTLNTTFSSSEEFDQLDLQAGHQALQTLTVTNEPQEQQQILENNHENIMACLVVNNKLAKVKNAHYGVKKRAAVPNCMEASLHNLFNILLHDGETFNLSLLPATLKINPKLREFYELQSYRITKVNSPEVGQAFMDMVSSHDFITYAKGDNYEMLPTVENFMAILNYFFGCHADLLKEFSQKFSDERRQVTFEQSGDHINITLTTKGKQPLYVTFIIKEFHAEISSSCIFQSSDQLFFRRSFTLPPNCDPLLAHSLQKKSDTSLLRKKSDMTYADLMTLYVYGEPSAENIHYFFVGSIPYLNSYPELKKILFSFSEDYHTTLASAICKAVTLYPEVKKFLESLDSNELRNNIGDTLLITTVTNSDTRDLTFIKLLLDKGANPDVQNDGESLLASTNYPEIMKLLLDYGANPNKQNRLGFAPLHCCTNPTMAKLLLDKGADVNAENKYGESALHLHVNNESMVMLLLANNANVYKQNEFGSTPLHKCRDPHIAKLLLDAGANPNAINKKGETPLHVVNNLPQLILLLERGANPNVDNPTGMPVLQMYVNNLEFVKLLLEYKVNPNLKNKQGKSPLHYCNNPVIIKLLIDHGADANVDNEAVDRYLESCLRERRFNF